MDALKRWAWVFGVAGLFAFLAFLSLWGVLGLENPSTTGFGVAAALLLAAYAFFDFDALEKGARTRVFRYGAGSFGMIVVVGVIAVVGYDVVRDHDHRWDLTQARRFSLSDRSAQVARGLDRDVQVFAFFRDAMQREVFEQVITGFAQETDRIEVQWFDPLVNYRMAEMFEVAAENGTVILVAGDERERLEYDLSEEAVLEALVKLTSDDDHRICWAMGHGEADPDDDSSYGGLGAVVIALEDLNYTITKSNVLTSGIERDCDALVVARPQNDWLAIERERLAVYLAEGGRVFVLIEPKTAPELAADLRRYGVIVGNDIAIDVDPAYLISGVDDPTVIVVSGDSLAVHPITGPLAGTITLWGARTTKGDPLAQGVKTHELISASRASWGETTLDVDPENPEATPEAFRPDEGSDLIGRVPLMVAAVIDDPAVIGVGAPIEFGEGGAVVDPVPDDFAATPGGRLVVIGDTGFATNGFLAYGSNNADLFTNTVAWLVEQDDQLGEGPESTEGDALTLNVIEGALVWLVHVFVVPGLSVGLAVLMMIRRRFL